MGDRPAAFLLALRHGSEEMLGPQDRQPHPHVGTEQRVAPSAAL